MHLGKLIAIAIAFTTAAPTVPSADRDTVVATVGDEPIRLGELERLVTKLTRGKTPKPDALRFLQAQAIEEIVARRLVLAYAQRSGESATAAEIAAERADLKSQLATRRRSLEDYLKTESIGAADFERQLTWKAVWRKYVARYATDERLAAYFAAHHREFDGTQLVVSHILLRPSAGGEKTQIDPLKQAEKIRTEITAGKLAFAEAARKYSAGPSGKDGGRLGLIGRHGPMDVSFSRAAFALEAGQVSPPVKTSFGVHLIRCDQIKPGATKLADVRKELEDALSVELLDKLAGIEREHTTVKYMGLLPHFNPGTHEVESASTGLP